MDNTFLVILLIFISFSIKPIKAQKIYRYYLKGPSVYHVAEFNPTSNDNYVHAFMSHLPMLFEWKNKDGLYSFKIISYQGGCWYFDDNNNVNLYYEYDKLSNYSSCYFYYKGTYILRVLNYPNLHNIDNSRISLHEILVCDDTNLEYYNLFDIRQAKDIDGNYVEALVNKIVIKTHFFEEYDSIYAYYPENKGIYYFNFEASYIGEEISLTCNDRYEYREFFSKELIIYKHMKDINYDCKIGILKIGEENKELDLYPDFLKKQEEKKKQRDEEEEKKEKKYNKKVAIIYLTCLGLFFVLLFICIYSRCKCRK